MAKKNDANAQFEFALMCKNGLGGQLQLKQAIKWYRRAAQQDHPESLYRLSVLLRNDKPHESLRFLVLAAELLHKKAQYELGCLYLKSNQMTETNVLDGGKWLRLSEMPVGAQSALLLGKAYMRNSDQCKRYQADSFYWLQQAANKHQKEACYEVGLAYEKGRGVSIDRNQAITSYLVAAKQGYAKAYYPLAELLKFARRHQEALTWYHAADKEFNFDATLNLARYYRYGNEVEMDIEQSLRLYQRLADINYPPARTELATWLIESQLIGTDPQKFMPYLKLAADKPHFHHESSYHYGFYLYQQNCYAKALIYFKKCKNLLNTAEALYSFADVLEKTSANKIDIFNAHFQAADLGHLPSVLKIAQMLEAKEVCYPGNRLMAARAYYKKAAQSDIWLAKFHFARFLEEGIGGPKNESGARSEYEKIYLHHNSASYRLACMFLEGRGGAVDGVQGFALLKSYIRNIDYENRLLDEMSDYEKKFSKVTHSVSRKTLDPSESISTYSQLDYIDAHYRLGMIYQYKNQADVKNMQCLLLAKEHYQIAAKFEHMNSLYALGKLYEQGLFGQRSIEKSKSYYQKAAELGHHLALIRLSGVYRAKRSISSFWGTDTLPTDQQLLENKDNCILM